MLQLGELRKDLMIIVMNKIVTTDKYILGKYSLLKNDVVINDDQMSKKDYTPPLTSSYVSVG